MPYIPHTAEEVQAMLTAIGHQDIEDLFQGIPAELRFQGQLNVPAGVTEIELDRLMESLAQRNLHAVDHPCFMGAGAYDHYIPAIIDFLVGRSEFWTSYTPYQPEASQGNLQAIFEYQTLICQLTGLDLSNASLYDGATALAEAILMSQSGQRKTKILLASTIHPEYLQVVNTYLADLDLRIVLLPSSEGRLDLAALQRLLTPEVGTVALQTPNFFGLLEEAATVSQLAHEQGATVIHVVNPISLGVLANPGQNQADIAVGEGQPLGIPMAYGGPWFGFLAARESFLRKMPGRIVGQTVDGRGDRGFVLTLQTREQHIRREKATSNICTNQALMTLRALVYLSTVGRQGFAQVAQHCVAKAHYLAEEISRLPGYGLRYQSPFFHEFVITCPLQAGEIVDRLVDKGILAGVPLARWFTGRERELMIAVTEKRTRAEMDALVAALKEIKP